MNRRSRRFILAGIFPVFCLAVLAPAAKSQSQEVTIPDTGQVVPVCKPADLDSHVSFFRAKTQFTVAFNIQNISEIQCAPQPAIGFPEFDTAHGPQATQSSLCIDCEDRLPDGTYRVHAPVVLKPGEIAHQTFRWNTVAPTAAVKCLKLKALAGAVFVVTPQLFKPVCSQIAVSRVYAGAFVPPARENLQPTGKTPAGEIFALSSSKPRYYQGDIFDLHVVLRYPHSARPSSKACPTLFLRERSPDGDTRFDNVRAFGFEPCKTFWPTWNGMLPVDWQSRFEVDSGAESRWTGIGEHTFELFEPVGSSHDGEIRFACSNKLAVQIDDPALIARTWSGKANGIGVDVTLDKSTYELGENIWLHIAVENFDAPVSIYATSPMWDPFKSIGIEVRGARGRLLPESERYPFSPIWIGEGHGPVLFPPGKLVPIERSLAIQGWLPNQPGVYTVVVTWHALQRTHPERGLQPPQKYAFKSYATVRATASFRVVGGPSPEARWQP